MEDSILLHHFVPTISKYIPNVVFLDIYDKIVFLRII